MRQKLNSRRRIHTAYRIRSYPLLLEILEDRLPPGDLSGGLAAGGESAAAVAEAEVVDTSGASAGEGTYVQDVELLPVAPTSEAEAVEGGRGFEADVLASPFDLFGSESSESGLDLWGTTTADTFALSLPDGQSYDGFGDVWSEPGITALERTVETPSATEQTQLMSALSALTFYAGLTPNVEIPSTAEAVSGQASDVLAATPLSFEANVGQTDARVDFLTRGPGYTMFLTPREAVLSLQKLADSPVDAAASESAVIRMQIEGGNPDAQATGQNALAGTVNYFVGNDPSLWHSGVDTYGRVQYQDVYPGIDLVYYGNAKNDLEYDFIVAPGADSGVIRLNYSGADRVELDAQGDLVLHIGDSQVRQHRPFTYQEVGGVRQEVASRYVFQGPQQIGFEIGAHDASLPLVIDPVLAYSTYLGGSGIDLARAVSVDPTYALAMVTGLTTSANFPTLNPQQPTLQGAADAFVAMYNVGTGQRVYATYLGGTSLDEGGAVAIDPYYGSGLGFVTGTTSSTNFPTTAGTFRQTYQGGDSDAFVVLLSQTGTILYGTYLGGSGADEGLGIAVDMGFNPSVTGSTTSANFPTTGGALQPGFGGGVDAFVSRLDWSLAVNDLSTFLGGEGDEFGLGIAVDVNNEIFVTGSTGSDTFPVTANAYQPVLAGLEDAFLTHLSTTGTPVFSTYLGGVDLDIGFSVAVDAYYGTGTSWITGSTSSRNFPRVAASQLAYGGGGSDAFTASFDSAGNVLFSTYLGGSGDDQGLSTAVDYFFYQSITGSTDSTNFPRLNALQNTYGGGDNDAFVTQVDPSGQRYSSTFLGGSGDDQGLGIGVDIYGLVYVVGMTGSTNYPREGAHQPTYGGGQYDAFLSVLAP